MNSLFRDLLECLYPRSGLLMWRYVTICDLCGQRIIFQFNDNLVFLLTLKYKY